MIKELSPKEAIFLKGPEAWLFKGTLRLETTEP
jgi:hypothetical protein